MQYVNEIQLEKMKLDHETIVDDSNMEADKNLRKETQEKWDKLVQFIREHIKIMLWRLYDAIKIEENRLNQVIKIEEERLNQVNEPEWQSQRNYREREWLKELSCSGNVRIVGPVGERPLHVCALSVHRFGHINFENMGNYVAKGIVEGILDFVEGDPLNWNEDSEVTSQYGKDYCAMVGHYILKRSDNNQNYERSAGMEPVTGDVTDVHSAPYWKQILKWQRAHLHPGGFFKAPQRFLEMLVSTGIYEGETVLFPFIAGRHLRAIDRLLKWQTGNTTKAKGHLHRCYPVPYFLFATAKASRVSSFCTDPVLTLIFYIVHSFLLLAVQGLFFHPMHRRSLTSFSLVKGWLHYIKVRFQDINLEASSKLSYFGLNVLSFAVRCALPRSTTRSRIASALPRHRTRHWKASRFDLRSVRRRCDTPR
jgi:hypothetical protein